MSQQENLEKAYTAVKTAAGTNWAGTAGTDTLRDQVGSPGAEVWLTDAQQKYLIDQVINESVLLGQIRKVDMKKSRVEIPRMGVGTRIMRSMDASGTRVAGGHLENADYGPQVAPDFETLVLTSSKLVLPWTVSNEFFEDNPEGSGAEARIADIMATQAANDLEDLAINGDVAASDDLLCANEGFLKLATSGSNVKDFNSAAFTTDVFEQMLRTLPTKYRKNKKELRLYVSPTVELDYIQTIAARMGDLGDQFLAGTAGTPQYGGIPVVSVPYMPDDDSANTYTDNSRIMLTHPDNLVWGVQRDMKMLKSTEGKQAIHKDERYYALHCRVDFLIQNKQAFVLGKEIRPRAV